MQNHEEHQGTSKKTRSKFDLLERLGTMVSRPNSMISIYVCAVQLDLSCTLLTVMSQNWLRYQETTTASKAQTSGSGWEGMDWSTYVVYFTSPKRGEDRHVPRSHPILDSCKPFPCARVWHSLTIAPQGLARHQPHVLSVHVVECLLRTDCQTQRRCERGCETSRAITGSRATRRRHRRPPGLGWVSH